MAAPTSSGEDLLIFTDGDTTAEKLFVKKVMFLGGPTGVVGDTCTLTDGNSKTRAVLVLNVADGMVSETFSFDSRPNSGLHCDGLTITLTHGTAYIYL
jgi:hypothetical protein